MTFLICILLASFATYLGAQSGDSPKVPEPMYKAGAKGVKPAKPLLTPEPQWPESARKKQFEGVIVLEGYVGTDGNFHDAKVIRSLQPALDAAAVEAVGKWKFKPCTKDGTPVNCKTNLEIAFNLF